MNLVKSLSENPFVMAPMAAITDNAFRSFMKEMGVGIVVSELVSSNGIKFGSDKTLRMLKFDSIQHPVGIQIFGEDPLIMAEAAKRIQDLGADFVDLNFGCPVKKVVQKGAGSAILKDLIQVQTMISTIKKAITIPLTIKTRTGWDETTRNAIEVAHIAHEEGVTWMAIHGRTRTQDYEGKANWDYIAEVKSKAKLPIIGNGDILTAEQAVMRLKTTGCDAVMIGRGCLKNPWIFLESLALFKNLGNNQTTAPVLFKNYPQAFERLKFYLEQNFDSYVVSIQLRKFAGWFSSGYPGGTEFRKSIFQFKEVSTIYNHTMEYFNLLEKTRQADTSHEAFLMGGHG